MLLTGLGSVRIEKNCNRDHENAARGRRPLKAFSRPRLTNGFVYATLSLNWLTRHLQTIRKNLCIERVTQVEDKETKRDVLKNRFISNYFLLVAFSSSLKFCTIVFFRCEILCKV